MLIVHVQIQVKADQVEAFKGWIDTQGDEVARVLCVVDCRLAEKHPKLMAWFEA